MLPDSNINFVPTVRPEPTSSGAASTSSVKSSFDKDGYVYFSYPSACISAPTNDPSASISSRTNTFLASSISDLEKKSTSPTHTNLSSLGNNLQASPRLDHLPEADAVSVPIGKMNPSSPFSQLGPSPYNKANTSATSSGNLSIQASNDRNVPFSSTCEKGSAESIENNSQAYMTLSSVVDLRSDVPASMNQQQPDHGPLTSMHTFADSLKSETSVNSQSPVKEARSLEMSSSCVPVSPVSKNSLVQSQSSSPPVPLVMESSEEPITAQNLVSGTQMPTSHTVDSSIDLSWLDEWLAQD